MYLGFNALKETSAVVKINVTVKYSVTIGIFVKNPSKFEFIVEQL